jgi:hypothetical protein
MIVYSVGEEYKFYQSRTDRPNSDWTGKAEHVIDENNPANDALIRKIKSYAPLFSYVTDANGNLIDVEKTGDFEREEPKEEIDILIEENKTLKEQISMLEDCIVEMAGIVYA